MDSQMNINNSKPKKEYVLDYSNLCGGINLWDPDDRLKPGESPEMKNLLWRNGMLCSRKGQYFLNSSALGQGYAAFPRFWHGCIFAHIGDAIYRFDPESGDSELLCSGIPEVRGTFFTYSDKLYYKTTGVYKEISAELVNDEWSFTAATVYPYEPIILINASPQSGAGDLYQPENRLSSRKTVWYNASNGVRTYVLPVIANRVTYVEVDGVQLTTGWSYDRVNGKVLFQTAPPVTDPATPTVHILPRRAKWTTAQSRFIWSTGNISSISIQQSRCSSPMTILRLLDSATLQQMRPTIVMSTSPFRFSIVRSTRNLLTL